jgi:hypothetical protein
MGTPIRLFLFRRRIRAHSLRPDEPQLIGPTVPLRKRGSLDAHHRFEDVTAKRLLLPTKHTVRCGGPDLVNDVCRLLRWTAYAMRCRSFVVSATHSARRFKFPISRYPATWWGAQRAAGSHKAVLLCGARVTQLFLTETLEGALCREPLHEYPPLFGR